MNLRNPNEQGLFPRNMAGNCHLTSSAEYSGVYLCQATEASKFKVRIVYISRSTPAGLHSETKSQKEKKEQNKTKTKQPNKQ